MISSYSTSGSAPKTRGFEVIVSVAVIAIFSSLIPLAAQIPFPLTAFGIAVYDIGLSGKSISKCEITVLYFLFCSFEEITTNFFGVNPSAPESSFLAIIVEPS